MVIKLIPPIMTIFLFRFDVAMALNMNITVFLHMTPFGLIKRYQYFGPN